MADPSHEARRTRLLQVLRKAMRPEVSAKFEKAEWLDKLLEQGFEDEHDLQGITREDLVRVGLPAAREKDLLTFFGGSPAAGIEQLVLEKLEEVRVQNQEKLEAAMMLMQVILNDSIRPASSSKTERKTEYRKKAIRYYNPDSENSSRLRCMLLEEYFDGTDIVAGHIYQLSWSRGLRDLIGLKVNDPSNILLLLKTVEEKFDRFEWTLKPLPLQNVQQEDGSYCLMQPYKVLVLNPRLLDTSHAVVQHLSTTKKWSDLHGKLLFFGAGEEDARPSRRACGLHATFALRFAQLHLWNTNTGAAHMASEDLMVNEAAWESPTFNRAIMDTFLTDATSRLWEQATEDTETAADDVLGEEG